MSLKKQYVTPVIEIFRFNNTDLELFAEDVTNLNCLTQKSDVQKLPK